MQRGLQQGRFLLHSHATGTVPAAFLFNMQQGRFLFHTYTPIR